MTRYDYKELKRNVLENENQANIDRLGEWFQLYGEQYWNGEYYDADDFKLIPICEENECGQYEIKGYQIR